MRKYKLKVESISDTGEIVSPDGSKVRMDKLNIKKDGKYVNVIAYEYAFIALGDAHCICGEGVSADSVCLLLKDGSTMYPAKCCNSAVFFENTVEVMELD